jgi:hypothetical protein
MAREGFHGRRRSSVNRDSRDFAVMLREERAKERTVPRDFVEGLRTGDVDRMLSTDLDLV